MITPVPVELSGQIIKTVGYKHFSWNSLSGSYAKSGVIISTKHIKNLSIRNS
jgi:hypothetical protein